MSAPENQQNNRQQYTFNLAMAAVASQVGCLTLIIVFGALIAGLWLDRTFETKPLFTILFMLGSMPVTLYVMYKVVTTATNRMKPVTAKKPVENPEGGSES